MQKLPTVPWSLILLLLSGWLGSAAQPAAAQQTVTLAGRVTDTAGNAVPDAWICAHLPTEEWWVGTCSGSASAGDFQLNVAPAVYVVTVRPVFPLRQTRHRLEVSREGVTGLVLTVSRDPMPFVPDDPPKAALISISPPMADGEVAVTGTAGAVAPGSAVVIITLETGHFTTAQATAEASRRPSLLPPAHRSSLKPTRSGQPSRSLYPPLEVRATERC